MHDTKQFTLDVVCAAPIANGCKPGTPASIRWAAAPGTSIVWFGAFPDSRSLSGTVGHYDFTVGTVGQFQLFGDDLKQTTVPFEIAGTYQPAVSPTAIGPPSLPAGTALINEAGFHRGPNINDAQSGRDLCVTQASDVYLDAWYAETGYLRQITITQATDKWAHGAFNTARTGRDGSAAILPHFLNGADLAWSYAPGYHPVALDVFDWSGFGVQYDAFPTSLTYLYPSGAANKHLPQRVILCVAKNGAKIVSGT